MYARLYQLKRAKKIIAPEQYGFRKDTNMETVSYTVTDHILKNLNEHSQILAIFCDPTKVFDCVIHNILLDKLVVYGIHKEIISWFKSYLENRKKRVETCHNEKGKVYSI
jgi:hypothetical protein